MTLWFHLLLWQAETPQAEQSAETLVDLLSAMLRISQLSGQAVAELDEEFLKTLNEKRYGNSVRALKWHLQPAGETSIYRLKLISGSSPLDDACPLASLIPSDLVLMMVNFHSPTESEEDQFLAAAAGGRTAELESLLQLPINPNAVTVPPNLDHETLVDMSALSLACHGGHLEAVEVLLDAGQNTTFCILLW